jgi:hypothetical protein
VRKTLYAMSGGVRRKLVSARSVCNGFDKGMGDGAESQQQGWKLGEEENSMKFIFAIRTRLSLRSVEQNPSLGHKHKFRVSSK